LPVYNRFDHTVLNEIKAYATYKGIRREIQLPALEPHSKSIIEIAGENWENNEKLMIEFLTADNQLIDTYLVTLGEEKIKLPQTVYQETLKIEETDNKVIIKGNGFEIPFCKETGLICNAKSGDKILIEKGPFLNMDVNLSNIAGTESSNKASRYISSDADWKKTNFAYQQKDGHVWVSITGVYGKINMNIQIDIASEGKLTFDYIANDVPNGFLRETGLRFYLDNSIEYLKWKRNGYWRYYPENDFAGNEGETEFYSAQQSQYGKPPTQAWYLDTHNYFYWADAGAGSSKPLTQAAKGMKENVYFYTLSTKDKNGFSVISTDASIACRTNRLSDEQLALYVNNRWDYPEIAWGNYCKNIENIPCFGRITFIMF